MRREPFSEGSYVHIYNRGTRKMDIVRDDSDRWRFLKLLRYLNDENVPRNWEREIGPEHIRAGFDRPKRWGPQKPYVSILAYCLMDNHFHLLIRENIDGGVSKFMQRICTSMSSYHNAKYGEHGSLFQGSYKARTVRSDRQLQYLAAYIHVTNPLQRYPGGLERAVNELDLALTWAESYPFSSLSDHLRSPSSNLLDPVAVEEVLLLGNAFRVFAKDVVRGRRIPDDYEDVTIDME